MTEAFCQVALRMRYPYNFPLLGSPGKYGGDFSNWIDKFRQIHTTGFFRLGPEPYLYPPASAPFQWIFSICPIHPTRMFYVGCLVTVAVLCYAFARALIQIGVAARSACGYTAALAVTSYPLWFCLRQGNIEVFLFGLMAAGVFLWLSGRPRLSAVALGLAGAAKIYPLIFLALYVRKRQWSAIAICFAVGLIFTIASLWLIYPDVRVALAETRIGLARAGQLQFLGQNVPQGGFDHSLLGAYKRLARELPPEQVMKTVVNGYILGAGVLSLAVFWFRLRAGAEENLILGLTAVLLLMMPLSYDYTLLHLYIPFAVIALGMERRRGLSIGMPLLVALCCFALEFSCQTEFLHHGTTLQDLLKTAGLLTLLLLSCRKMPLLAEGSLSGSMFVPAPTTHIA